MNVLLVDDDRFVIEALKQKINWQELGIQNIHTSSNIFQAKKVFEEHDIHILISDIEMPRGTGLELLAWIRSEGYNVQAIFLTNFASFNYAQKAIELQSIDYFLKPVEFDKLELVIKKAVKKAKASRLEQDVLKAGEYWHKYKEKIVEDFWRDYVNTGFAGKDLPDVIREKNLHYASNDRFLPVMIKLFPYKLTENMEIESLVAENSRMKDKLERLVLQEFGGNVEALIEWEKNHDFLLMIKGIKTFGLKKADLLVLGDKLIGLVNSELQCDAQCIVHKVTSLDHLPGAISGLKTFNKEIIHSRNRTIVYETYGEELPKYVEPKLDLLEYCLQNGNRSGFINRCRQYLNNRLEKEQVHYHTLCNFRLDITQLIFTHLKEKQIMAHHLFHGKVNDFLLEKSTRSIEDFMTYLSYLVHVSLNYMAFTDSRKSVVKKICEYIDAHYQENFSRNDLAEIVYLSPDHIARLFKKETGTSLINYITDKRIRVARDLLEHTDLPVHVISEKVGYENYSYFTKLFKKVTNFTPLDYRKRYGEGRIENK